MEKIVGIGFAIVFFGVIIILIGVVLVEINDKEDSIHEDSIQDTYRVTQDYTPLNDGGKSLNTHARYNNKIIWYSYVFPNPNGVEFQSGNCYVVHGITDSVVLIHKQYALKEIENHKLLNKK